MTPIPDFHENATRGLVADSRPQTDGRTDGRGLHISILLLLSIKAY